MTLQEMRLKKGLTQEQASKILEINSDYLSMVENKIRNPSDKLKKKGGLNERKETNKKL